MEAQLNTIHNLHYYQDLMAELRGAIARGELADFVSKFDEEQQILQNEGGTGDGQGKA